MHSLLPYIISYPWIFLFLSSHPFISSTYPFGNLRKLADKRHFSNRRAPTQAATCGWQRRWRAAPISPARHPMARLHFTPQRK
jgi:hypothetical protein